MSDMEGRMQDLYDSWNHQEEEKREPLPVRSESAGWDCKFCNHKGEPIERMFGRYEYYECAQCGKEF